jgi:tryptophanyl-tRNA synthetase
LKAELQNPADEAGHVLSDQTRSITNSDDVTRKKIMEAITDSDSKISFDQKKKLGIANLLNISAAGTD